MNRLTPNTGATVATGRLWARLGLCALQAMAIHPAHAADTSAAQQLNHWTALAGAPAQAERGQALFKQRQGGEWSCASCHGTPPTGQGQHASTGKAIAPLAPAFNAKAFSDSAKVDKWFKRNCKDVFSRECSAQEKADVLAYLIQLKP